MTHLGGDQLTGQRRRIVVSFFFRQVALQHRVRGPLPEIRLEDGRECEPTTGPPAADAVSPRRHRPGR